MSDGRIAEKTGRTWAEWMRTLDADGASVMPHREIARLVHVKHGIGDWWAQTVTVGYERLKGLREIGQRRDGGYEVNKSKTFNVPMTTLFEAWAVEEVRRRWLSGVNATVRTATSPKSIRLRWPDGTVVIAQFTAKGDAKSAVAVTQHETRGPGRGEQSEEVLVREARGTDARGGRNPALTGLGDHGRSEVRGPWSVIRGTVHGPAPGPRITDHGLRTAAHAPDSTPGNPKRMMTVVCGCATPASRSPPARRLCCRLPFSS
jgi:hypothetical protein